jgi:hypothetical protein
MQLVRMRKHAPSAIKQKAARWDTVGIKLPVLFRRPVMFAEQPRENLWDMRRSPSSVMRILRVTGAVRPLQHPDIPGRMQPVKRNRTARFAVKKPASSLTVNTRTEYASTAEPGNRWFGFREPVQNIIAVPPAAIW